MEKLYLEILHYKYSLKKNIENINDLKRECVIFWKGYASIMINSLNCIDANTFHMNTKTEPLS